VSWLACLSTECAGLVVQAGNATPVDCNACLLLRDACNCFVLLFTLLQAACSKKSSEDNRNAVGSYWSIIPNKQWLKPAYALDFSMFSQSVSRIFVWGHTQLICNWLQSTAAWKFWCHSQVSAAGALVRDKLQQHVGKTCRQTQKQGQGQMKWMQAARLDMLRF